MATSVGGLQKNKFRLTICIYRSNNPENMAKISSVDAEKIDLTGISRNK